MKTVTLIGGPMAGWSVTPDAACLAADWDGSPMGRKPGHYGEVYEAEVSGVEILMSKWEEADG